MESEAACESFAHRSWIGVYVETAEFIDGHLASLANCENKYRGKEGRVIDDSKMGNKYRDQCNDGRYGKHIRIEFQLGKWWD